MKKIIYIFMLMLFALNPLIAKNLDKDSLALNLSFAKEVKKIILNEDISNLMSTKSQMRLVDFNERYTDYAKKDFLFGSIIMLGATNGNMVAFYNPHIDAIMLLELSNDRPLPKINNLAFMSGETFRDGQKSSLDAVYTKGKSLPVALVENTSKTQVKFEEMYPLVGGSGNNFIQSLDSVNEYNFITKELLRRLNLLKELLIHKKVLLSVINICEQLSIEDLDNIKLNYPNAKINLTEKIYRNLEYSICIYDCITYSDSSFFILMTQENPENFIFCNINKDGNLIELSATSLYELLKIN